MKRILDGEGRSIMGRRTATLVLGGVVLALAAAGRLTSAAGVSVTTQAGPDDMVGRWTATMAGGEKAGQPAADMDIALTPDGPGIVLTLYRYRVGGEGKPEVERPPVIQHSVQDGVLRFRTRVEDFRLREEDPPTPMEGDWEFAVVGRNAGELRLVRNSVLEARKAQGRPVPPKAPPLAMKRVSTP